MWPIFLAASQIRKQVPPEQGYVLLNLMLPQVKNMQGERAGLGLPD